MTENVVTIMYVEEIFPQTNEMLPREFKLKRKLFMKRGKMNRFIKMGEMHHFIKEELSEQSILLDGRAEMIILEQSTKRQSRVVSKINRARHTFCHVI